jgi:serine/threonine protein kinase
MCFVQLLLQVLLELKVTKPCKPSTATPADVGCAMQVCKAVSGLHQREIVHGDLRPANVMWFSSSFSMKLVDFARWSDKGMPTPLNITLTCAAPEVRTFSLFQLQHLAHGYSSSLVCVNLHSFACRCACLLKRALSLLQRVGLHVTDNVSDGCSLLCSQPFSPCFCFLCDAQYI